LVSSSGIGDLPGTESLGGEKPDTTYIRSGDSYGCVRNGKREFPRIWESVERIERRD
jgi:hypothetical protein